MRAKFLVPGIAVAAFAVTVLISGWPDRSPDQRGALQPQTQPQMQPQMEPTPIEVLPVHAPLAVPRPMPMTVPAPEGPFPHPPPQLPAFIAAQAARDREAERIRPATNPVARRQHSSN